MTVEQWFTHRHFTPAPFQRQVWQSYAKGENGLLIAPTGSGKTYAVMGAVTNQALKTKRLGGGLRLLWITPLRALAGDIAKALQEMSDGTGLGWQVELRVGDTSASVKARQRKKLPEILVTTPESLHIMLSYPGASALFAGLECVVIDEWHDLLPTKRGVMIQLALAHLHNLAPELRVWGISATIGNPEEAMQVLLAAQQRPSQLIFDKRKKALAVQTVIPQTIERFPWAGHIGSSLLAQVKEIVRQNRSTLVFTNTRNQSEIWYRKLLQIDPDLAGQIALHHGSLSSAERTWVEGALHEGRLKVVICTSSLDLGVDFRPVDAVIQIGSPKGVARFVQRGGRSGHAPGETSRIYFVPTHALELFEAAALKKAVKEHRVESLHSPKLSLDVLVQWLVTLGIGDGFRPDVLKEEAQRTAVFGGLSDAAWQWALDFVTTGGPALGNYDQYQKLENKNGYIQGSSSDIAKRHRLNIGTITSSSGVRVQVLRGQVIGSVDEGFAGSLRPGQIFWLSGRALEFVRLRDMTVWVRAARAKTGITPTWSGGRLPLSGQLAALLRAEVAQSKEDGGEAELRILSPLLALQTSWSHVPSENELLIEQFSDRYGHHLILYPFEGRATHEILASLFALRLGKSPNTFSIAVNDYGFELLAAVPATLDSALLTRLLSTEMLLEDVRRSITASSLPRRQFRTIATIAGLVSKGRPGKPQATRHLQASSEMIYDVLQKYDSDNKLLDQAYTEVMEQVIDMQRLRDTIQRLSAATPLFAMPPRPTPFAFPLIAERFRERLSTEELTDRMTRLQQQLEKYAARS